ncbi:FeoA family protein [Spirochaetia bacterium 38H-sp]|uniref:FeoA family protein n=1 Tax=Rarispira pelagica TaxID=3141764 RepID=A0ABU9UCD7_9SPIR
MGRKKHGYGGGRRGRLAGRACCVEPSADFSDDIISISSLREGERAVVVGFSGQMGPYRRKLLSMGFIPGTEILLKRRAPLGDPVEIQVRGFNVSLRKEEANVLLLRRTA